MRNEAHIILVLILSTLHPSRAFSPLATTFESYKAYHLDPLTDEFETEALELPDATRSRASASTEYWTRQSAEARERLRGMSPMADAAQFDRHHPSHSESWIHYRRALEALVPHHDHGDDDRFHWPRHAAATSWADYSEMVAGLASPALGVDDERDKKGTFSSSGMAYQVHVNVSFMWMYACTRVAVLFVHSHAIMMLYVYIIYHICLFRITHLQSKRI